MPQRDPRLATAWGNRTCRREAHYLPLDLTSENAKGAGFQLTCRNPSFLLGSKPGTPRPSKRGQWVLGGRGGQSLVTDLLPRAMTVGVAASDLVTTCGADRGYHWDRGQRAIVRMYLFRWHDPICIHRGIANLNVVAVPVRIAQLFMPAFAVGGYRTQENKSGHEQKDGWQVSFHRMEQSQSPTFVSND